MTKSSITVHLQAGAQVNGSEGAPAGDIAKCHGHKAAGGGAVALDIHNDGAGRVALHLHADDLQCTVADTCEQAARGIRLMSMTKDGSHLLPLHWHVPQVAAGNAACASNRLVICDWT
jgi:hypothetical protein